MSALTVRIRSETHKTLRELASRSGKSLQDVLTDAIELYRRSLLLDEANTAFAALRENAVEWQRELEERRVWDVTLQDTGGD
jgi:predicted transcriptional regulator